eukprot:TRINITY_DN24138_c0_g1_i1.p1 TRINITY_DN24138_c0_g1~~TRINITY_DN24138_c0_g1_i1.p1  ORF type:complete len:194 (-),score=28.42 TRINITY_DN24138_c0_g1_i1:94-675(-)
MAIASAAPRLVGGEALRNFLLGRWTLSKKFDYRIGGGRGTMEGIATFTETLPRPDVLMYEERGDVILEGLAKPVEAYRHYCFNTSQWPVEVYFVDDPTKKHLPSLLPELDVHTSFFIPLTFGSGEGTATSSCEANFDHLCIDDLYSGHLKALSEEHFEWNWTVKGPNKDGNITCSYRRVISSAADSSSYAPRL